MNTYMGTVTLTCCKGSVISHTMHYFLSGDTCCSDWKLVPPRTVLRCTVLLHCRCCNPHGCLLSLYGCVCVYGRTERMRTYKMEMPGRTQPPLLSLSLSRALCSLQSEWAVHPPLSQSHYCNCESTRAPTHTKTHTHVRSPIPVGTSLFT